MQSVCCSYTISPTHTHTLTPPRGGLTSAAKLDFGRICWLHLNDALLFYLFHRLWTKEKKREREKKERKGGNTARLSNICARLFFPSPLFVCFLIKKKKKRRRHQTRRMGAQSVFASVGGNSAETVFTRRTTTRLWPQHKGPPGKGRVGEGVQKRAFDVRSGGMFPNVSGC